MNKTVTSVVLPAEEAGWEVWLLQKSGLEFKTRLEGEVLSKSDMVAGTCLALPVNQVATQPVVVASEDEDLYRGAAQMALEKAGFYDADLNDLGCDCQEVEKIPNQVTLAASGLVEDCINPDHDIRLCSFDYSARFYQPESAADYIAIWKEQGSWVLACYRNSIPFYTEPLGELGEDLSITIDLLISQFLIKGMLFTPLEVLVWSPLEEGAEGVTLQMLQAGYALVEAAKPAAKMPTKALNFQPLVVSQWHERQAARAKMRVLVIGVLLIYISLVAWLWMRSAAIDEKIAVAEQQATALKPAWEENQKHFNKWDELAPLVVENWPLRVFKECKELLPPGQVIRFQQVEVQDASVKIRAVSPSLNAINRFDLALKKSVIFGNYQWQTRPPVKDPKTKQWGRLYEAQSLDYQEGY